MQQTKEVKALDEQVADLLGSMSLQEKVGQMTQVNLNVVLEGDSFNISGELDEALLRKAVVDFKVGSILNAINRPYSLERWHTIIRKIQETALETPLQIPVLYGIDSIHGATFTEKSTLFPHNLGLAATRNTQLARQIAEVTARETRASGIRWNFDPVLDIGRNPLWPRFPETFGEDVYLTAQMGLAMIAGYEQGGQLDQPTAVASCMKHFIGYSDPHSGKDRTPAYIPEIQLRELYLPQFQQAVKEGAATIMINSGELNGVPVHASKYLLTEVLREELGFTGLVVTDWEDVIRLQTRHHVAESPMEAVRMAVEAGIDISMVPHDFSFFTYLVELVEEGLVSMDRIDASVRRILLLKHRLGLFANPMPEPEAIAQFGKPEYKQLALQAAQESITLLKNDRFSEKENNPVLPLPATAKVLITGPAAHARSTLHGAWSYTWQGDNEYWYPENSPTIFTAIRDKIGKQQCKTSYKNGFGKAEYYYFEAIARQEGHHAPSPEKLEEEVAIMRRKAREVDYIILCLGEDAYAESPGALDDLYLPDYQQELALAAADTGKPVILVLTQGRPRIIRKIESHMQAILLAYQPGSQGGTAIADVLFGDYNPSGRLPFSYPAWPHDLIPYDHKYTDKVQELWPGFFTYQGYKPQYPFGYGLSYSTLRYHNLHLLSDKLLPGQQLKIAIDVQNAGTYGGEFSVDLYTRDLYASISPPQRRLRKFKRVALAAGETKTLQFTLRPEDLAFVGQDLQWRTESGDFEIFIGTECALFSYTTE